MKRCIIINHSKAVNILVVAGLANADATGVPLWLHMYIGTVPEYITVAAIAAVECLKPLLNNN